MLVTLSGIVIDVRPEQRENADAPMLVTPFGIVIVVSADAPPKTKSPTAAIPSGMTISVNSSSLKYKWCADWSGLASALAKLIRHQDSRFEMFTSVSPEQRENAESPMLVILSGIVIDVSPEQPENAQSPMLVTPSGIVIDVSPEQLENAPSPTPVTPSEIVIDVSPEQSENAQFPMLVTLLGIVTEVSFERLENAKAPILVNGYPPKTEGTTICPAVSFGMAPDPMAASPFETENVHVMPSTVSVKAKQRITANERRAKRRGLI